MDSTDPVSSSALSFLVPTRCSGWPEGHDFPVKRGFGVMQEPLPPGLSGKRVSCAVKHPCAWCCALSSPVLALEVTPSL